MLNKFYARQRKDGWVEIIRPTTETTGIREFIMDEIDAIALDIKQGLYEIVENKAGLLKVKVNLGDMTALIETPSGDTKDYCMDVFTKVTGIKPEDSVGSRYSLVRVANDIPPGYVVKNRMAGHQRSI